MSETLNGTKSTTEETVNSSASLKEWPPEFEPQPLMWWIVGVATVVYALTIPIAFVNFKVIARTSVGPL